MNDKLEPISFPDDLVLDRLVDGELSEAEYRELIRLLDARPENWRRCALSFLEAQAWRRELGAVRSEGVAPALQAQRSGRDRSPNLRQMPWTFGGLIAIASAASVLLALFLAGKVLPTPSQKVVSPMPDSVASRSPGGNTTGGNSPEATGRGSIGPWGEYRMVVNDENGQPSPIQMPIFSSDDPRAEWLMNDRATMPVDLIRHLQQLGFEVNRQRQWAPVGQSVDTPVLVPIEELQITPVSSRSYQ